MLETLKEIEAAATPRPWTIVEQGYVPETGALANLDIDNTLTVHLRNLAPEIFEVIEAALLVITFKPEQPEPFRDALALALEDYRKHSQELGL